MNKKIKFSLFSLFVGMVLIMIPHNIKADPCSDCSASFHSCNQACVLVGAKGGGCKLSCLFDSAVCRYEHCPHQYALRNASVYTMNFFRSANTLIGTLGGVSSDRLTVEDSDFPITATYCSEEDYLSKDPKKAYCHTDNHYSYVYNNQGCYILWYAGGYYTTDEVCYIKDAQGRETPLSSLTSSKTKETKTRGENAVDPSIHLPLPKNKEGSSEAPVSSPKTEKTRSSKS